MENTKVSSDEKPTGVGLATVTTGMQRDRDSIDDFEHVARETSPVEKTSKMVSEFEIDRPTQDFEEQYMPKHKIESKEVGLPESSVAGGLGLPGDSDDWKVGLGQLTKGPMDSSNLENFLRNEKGFMSSELNVNPDDFSGYMPKPPSENLIDTAALSEPMIRDQDLFNADFISNEATKHPESEKQAPVGPYGDMNAESDLGLPKAEDKLVESFNIPIFDGDYLRDTLSSTKSAGIDSLNYGDFDPSTVIADTLKPSPVADTSETNSDDGLGNFAETVEVIGVGLPLKEHTISDSTASEDKPAEPKKNPVPKVVEEVLDEIIEPKKAPSKPAEPKKSPASKEDTAGLGLDEITEPMELFCKMGLDAWFKPERLHPTVVELVYWRDPKKSGVVFGSVLGILLSLSYFSLISVIAYLSLLLLTGTIVYRIYKNVIQAVQKTSDGHPFKEILELDLTLPQDKVREMTDVTVTHLNAAALELRRLFLVEDLVDSIKFGVLLWCLTYLGSWFNGMTIIIIMFVAMFTLPKVYENNKAQIDQNLEIVRAKFSEVSAKVKAAVPIGKKPVVEEKKEQ